MIIVGISALYHDAAAVLLRDGVLVAAAQEERFSRRKHDASLPVQSVKFCLAQAGIHPRDIDLLVFYEKPLRKFERILSTQVREFPRSRRSFVRAMQTWLSNKLWVRVQLAKTFGVHPDKILFTEHHQSHAASAFLCSPYDEAAVLVMDGVGEWASTSLWHGRVTPEGTELKPLAELHFPHSVGLLYSALTAYLGFEVNEGEYKVMGMAPYGRPRFLEQLSRLVKREGAGAFQLDLDYFSFHYDPERSYTAKLEQLLGPARVPGTRFVTAQTEVAPGESAPSAAELRENQRFADIAASVQRLTEELVLEQLEGLHGRLPVKALCLAGGVALNSVANGRVVREGPFEEVFIQPAAGDAGGALGAALYAHEVLLKRPRVWRLDRTDFGAGLDREEIRIFLKDFGIPHRTFEHPEQLLEPLAERLAAGQVVGWVQGRFEWGPRALGQRSILADPRRAAMKERVNRSIKHREPFRPFAPAVISEQAERYFELERHGGEGDPSRFMLLTAPVKGAKQDQVQATTHVDGSSRVQRVERGVQPLYHGLLSRFGALTGVPVLMNTSFNLRGEPMVSTALEAFATFERSELDVLVLENFWIEKTRGSV